MRQKSINNGSDESNQGPLVGGPYAPVQLSFDWARPPSAEDEVSLEEQNHGEEDREHDATGEPEKGP